MKNKIYWYFKGYEDELETVNWKVINGQPDLASNAHALYDIMRHQAVKSGGRLRFSDDKPFTKNQLIKTFLPWVNEEAGIKALQALKDAELIDREEDGTWIITNSDEMFGHDTDMARYLRKHRQKPSRSTENELSNGYQCKPNDNQSETPPYKPPKENEEIKDTPSIPLESGSSESNNVGTDFGIMAKEFFDQYPKQGHFDDVVSWFNKMKPDKQTYSAILIALDRERDSMAWRSQGGRFIPLPANWLNKARWTQQDMTNAALMEEEHRVNAQNKIENGTMPIDAAMAKPKEMPKGGNL